MCVCLQSICRRRSARRSWRSQASGIRGWAAWQSRCPPLGRRRRQDGAVLASFLACSPSSCSVHSFLALHSLPDWTHPPPVFTLFTLFTLLLCRSPQWRISSLHSAHTSSQAAQTPRYWLRCLPSPRLGLPRGRRWRRGLPRARHRCRRRRARRRQPCRRPARCRTRCQPPLPGTLRRRTQAWRRRCHVTEAAPPPGQRAFPVVHLPFAAVSPPASRNQVHSLGG